MIGINARSDLPGNEQIRFEFDSSRDVTTENKSRGPSDPDAGLRMDCAADWMSCSDRARKNWIASKRLDLPAPFEPTKQVSGPKWTTSSSMFLKFLTFRRSSIGRERV
jgi:hypothetical protein